MTETKGTLKTGINRRTALIGMAGGVGALAMPWVARAQEDTIRIGFPTPLTGPYAAEANDQVRSAQLAVKQFNDRGGIGGRQIELLVRDGKLNAGEAATRTLELIEKDNVHAIVGALSAAVQLAVNEVTRAREVLYVSISQSDTINEVNDFSRYTFHEALNPHMTTQVVAKHTLKPGAKVAHLVADYAYGHEMLRGFKRAGEDIGVETVAEILHPLGAAEYSTFIPTILASGADVLCISNFGRDQANSIQQAVNFGVKERMQIVVPVILHNQRIAVGADVFEGVIGGANYWWGLEETVPSAKTFNDAFRDMYDGAAPTDYGAYGYSGVASLLMAMEKVGGTDTEAVVDALEGLTYDIAKGDQHYRACDHQSVQSVLVLKSKGSGEMENDADLFEIVANEPGSEDVLRSCAELGFPS